MVQEQIQKIRNRCAEVIARAKELYPHVNLGTVGIHFDLKGRAAGQARHRGGVYSVRFNRDMLTREAFDHVHDNTVPHEFAHIICMMNPSMGRSHDAGWQRICTALGGSGATRHKEETVRGKGGTYEYISTTGKKIRVGDKYHRLIQAGTPLTFKKDGGTLLVCSTYSIVGIRGRTLAQPIVKQGTVVPHPVPQQIAPKPVVHMPVSTTKVVSTIQTIAKRDGLTKADIARAIMAEGYANKSNSLAMIGAIMLATNLSRALATVYYKNNAARVGIPANYE